MQYRRFMLPCTPSAKIDALTAPNTFRGKDNQPDKHVRFEAGKIVFFIDLVNRGGNKLKLNSKKGKNA